MSYEELPGIESPFKLFSSNILLLCANLLDPGDENVEGPASDCAVSKVCDALQVNNFGEEELDDVDVGELVVVDELELLWSSSNTDESFLDLFRGGWSSKSSEDLVEATLFLQ